MHRLLERQLRRHFGKDFQPDENLSAFLAIIDSSYHDADKEHRLLQNALTINAAELSEVNERMRRQTVTELNFQKYALDQHAIVSIADNNGKIIYANGKFIEISQYAEAELLGQDHRIINSGYHSADFFKEMWQTIARGEIWHGEVRNQSKDGTHYWVDSTIVPFMDEQGKPLRYVSIRTDITARKKAEAVVMAAKVAAEEASRAKSDFLANMSHEIRTPMNGIIGMTELALDTDLNSEQREYLLLVKASADALLGIVNDILDFSKIEAGKMEIESVEFNLQDMLSQTTRTIALRAHQKGLELLLDIAPDVPVMLAGDPGRLRQVIINLLGNAIKFTEHGEIVVRAELSAGQAKSDNVCIKFSVSDTGIGIPKNKFQAIFESFSQADTTTTRKYGGTGLGLTISARLVELMHGQIGVQSEVGKGSTFHFDIAFSRAKVVAQPSYETGRLSNLHALVVDDNATNRKLAVELLRRWGVTSQAVEDGRQAIAELERAKQSGKGYQLLLLDVRMPEMDGFEVAEYIHAHPDLVAAPVMMLTSEGQRGDAARCRELGISAYLLKPYSQSDLFDAIMNTLGMDKMQNAPLITRHSLQQNKSQLKVLLAEDNSVNQLLATRLLQKFGHEVEVAENGLVAVEKWQSGDYDLILMDVDMPVLNGHGATQRIRDLEKNSERHTPIIGLTAHVMQGSREECIAAGMDGYLSKPINTEALWVELEAIRSGREPEVVIAAAAHPVAVTHTFSLEKALVLMDNDMSLMGEMARIFLSDYPGYLAKLGAAISQHDEKQITHLAHTIKGMLSVFFVQSVADIAARIEMQKGVDHAANYVELTHGLEWLQVELQKVCDSNVS